MLARSIAKSEKFSNAETAEETSEVAGCWRAASKRFLRRAIQKRQAPYGTISDCRLFRNLFRGIFHHLFVFCIGLIDFGLGPSLFDDFVPGTAAANR